MGGAFPPGERGLHTSLLSFASKGTPILQGPQQLPILFLGFLINYGIMGPKTLF